jgi:hypothetical protein
MHFEQAVSPSHRDRAIHTQSMQIQDLKIKRDLCGNAQHFRLTFCDKFPLSALSPRTFSRHPYGYYHPQYPAAQRRPAYRNSHSRGSLRGPTRFPVPPKSKGSPQVNVNRPAKLHSRGSLRGPTHCPVCPKSKGSPQVNDNRHANSIVVDRSAVQHPSYSQSDSSPPP